MQLEKRKYAEGQMVWNFAKHNTYHYKRQFVQKEIYVIFSQPDS